MYDIRRKENKIYVREDEKMKLLNKITTRKVINLRVSTLLQIPILCKHSIKRCPLQYIFNNACELKLWLNSRGRIFNLHRFKKIRFYKFLLDPLYSTSDSIGHPFVERLFLIGLASHQIVVAAQRAQFSFTSLKEKVLSRGQEKDSQTSTITTKYRCHQILPMVFDLNNSYGKIIHIELENTSVVITNFTDYAYRLDLSLATLIKHLNYWRTMRYAIRKDSGESRAKKVSYNNYCERAGCKDKLVNSENAQYTYFTAYNVECAMSDLDEMLRIFSLHSFQKVQPYRFSLHALYSTTDSIGHPLVVRLFLISLASYQNEIFLNISRRTCSTENTVLFHKSKVEVLFR
ncbi:hypothetical protein TSAR_006815 [Trichomalopsis sarcophagae]|uniref:Uncharacterized protein n=1 Tax=Trichomalopsis sarcophagae TaxID=543379 RepID=A0A232F2Z0_9HYME|nr:hypothetical protein TSAR_006815 [Trichomalopsis sarcophagae]